MEAKDAKEAPEETLRLASLRALDVLDTPAEERFDRITRLATRLLDVPVATIGLADGDRFWFKSRQGITFSEAPRDVPLCREAAFGRGTLVVPDARADARFAASPLVTSAPFARFFAAHPLADPDGRRLGALAVAGPEPRELGPRELCDLRDLARIAQHELGRSPAGPGHVERIGGKGAEERRRLIDPVTGLWAPQGILEVLRFGLVRARYERAPCAVVRARIGVPERAVDDVRAEVAQLLRIGTRAEDAVGTWADDQFLVVLFACDRASADVRARELRRTVDEHPVLAGLGVRMNQGWAAFDPGDPLEAAALIERAETALAEACNAGAGEVRAA